MHNYDLKKTGDAWKLTDQITKRTIRVFDTKEEAVPSSADILKKRGDSSLKIHKANGDYQEERTYPRSADPRRTPG